MLHNTSFRITIIWKNASPVLKLQLRLFSSAFKNYTTAQFSGDELQ